MTRLVLFDIDGTLIHTGGAGVKAFAKVFATDFHHPNRTERLKFAGRTDVSLVREFFTRHDIPPSRENFARFFDRYVFWLDHILAQSQTRDCPGVRAFLRALKHLPAPPLVGLLSGNIRLGAEIKLRHCQLWQDRPGRVRRRSRRSRADRRRGPRPRRARPPASTARRGSAGGRRYHPGIRCARAIGAKVLAVATGGRDFAQLSAASPDWVVQDLTQASVEAVAGCDA